MNDEYYMELALEEAKIALEGGNWPIGCVIELDGEVCLIVWSQIMDITL